MFLNRPRDPARSTRRRGLYRTPKMLGRGSPTRTRVRGVMNPWITDEAPYACLTTAIQANLPFPPPRRALRAPKLRLRRIPRRR